MEVPVLVEGEAPPQPQVIYIIQAPKQKIDIKENYAVNAATIVGIIHILCGVVAFTAEVCGISDGNIPFSTGIWTAVFFIISGSLAIAGARSGNKCLVVATLVMSIISTICAAILLILSSIMLAVPYHRNTSFGIAATVVCVVMGLMMLVVGITSASLTCRPLCCSSAGQGAVHYSPASALPPGLLHSLQVGLLPMVDNPALLRPLQLWHRRRGPQPTRRWLEGGMEDTTSSERLSVWPNGQKWG